MKKGFDYSKAKEISIDYKGKKITGSYVVQSKMVTVDSFYGQKSTQLGGMLPDSLAKILLRELADAYKE